MTKAINQSLAAAGIHLYGNPRIADAATVLQDAALPQYTANGTASALITSFIDPSVIKAATSPLVVGDIFGEWQKGDWTTDTAVFTAIEPTGETSAYGDYSNDATSGINQTNPTRQAYHYQTHIMYGDKQIDVANLSAINYVAQVQSAGIHTLNRYQNRTYLFGVEGLKNYGLTNDPALQPSVPVSGAGAKDAIGIYNDIKNIVARVIKQTRGIVDATSEMVLLVSPSFAAEHLTKTNQYNNAVSDLLAKNYPNLKVRAIPEYDTAAGHIVQVVAKEINGTPVVMPAYTEKLRTHRIEERTSHRIQKMSQGSFGAVITYPVAIATSIISN